MDMDQPIQMDFRPETSKCSRLERRKIISQSQQRPRAQGQTALKATNQQFYKSNPFNGITLEQYFKGTNFKVIEIHDEEHWKPQIEEEVKKTVNEPVNFRIKRFSATKRVIQDGLKSRATTNGTLQGFWVAKKQNSGSFDQQKPLVTTNQFFNEQDLMRRTYGDNKYLKIKSEIQNRFQRQERDLINKYAEKFQIYTNILDLKGVRSNKY